MLTVVRYDGVSTNKWLLTFWGILVSASSLSEQSKKRGQVLRDGPLMP
jgi:hypothetical protein